MKHKIVVLLLFSFVCAIAQAPTYYVLTNDHILFQGPYSSASIYVEQNGSSCINIAGTRPVSGNLIGTASLCVDNVSVPTLFMHLGDDYLTITPTTISTTNKSMLWTDLIATVEAERSSNGNHRK